MYDDLKDIRITVGYQNCDDSENSTSSSTCAVYLKSGRNIDFMDFCDSSPTNLTPTSAFYSVSVDKNAIGTKAIHLMSKCRIILPQFENDETTWKNISSFHGTFKCARVQGSSNYESLIVKKKNYELKFLMNKKNVC